MRYAGPTIARSWAATGAVFALIAAFAASALAETQPLTLQADPESVYAPPAPPREDEGVNAGGVHVDLQVNYATDYMYRGVERFDPPSHEDAPNLQFGGKLSFDLGKLPHPFVGLFVNVADSDPISRFEEIRPYFGVEYTIAPFTFEAGDNTYIFPDRDVLNTSEVYGKATFNDSILFHTDKPLLSPYIYGAYDYDVYNGWYCEAGVSHAFVIEETGITLTTVADVGYSIGNGFFHTAFSPSGHDSGFQHYDVGLIGSYSLNSFFNLPRRYGEFSFISFVYYTDGLQNNLRSTTQMWGGFGIGFHY